MTIPAIPCLVGWHQAKSHPTSPAAPRLVTPHLIERSTPSPTSPCLPNRGASHHVTPHLISFYRYRSCLRLPRRIVAPRQTQVRLAS
jgi:hypothetical protein